MDFPSQKIHRRNRRRLGRGQYPTSASVGVSVLGSADTVTIYCSAPVVVTGAISFIAAPLTIISQTQTDPTIVVLVMSGPIAGLAWTMPNTQPNLRTPQGGPVTGGNGTFAGAPPAVTNLISVTGDGTGNYTLVFDAVVSVAANGIAVLGWVAYSDSLRSTSFGQLAWQYVITQMASSAPSFTVNPLTFATDYSLFAILQPQAGITSANPINLTQGVVAIM